MKYRQPYILTRHLEAEGDNGERVMASSGYFAGERTVVYRDTGEKVSDLHERAAKSLLIRLAVEHNVDMSGVWYAGRAVDGLLWVKGEKESLELLITQRDIEEAQSEIDAEENAEESDDD